MKTHRQQLLPPVSRRKYGITESKKAELDALTLQVIDTQYDVDQYQSMVTSLTDKVNNFQGFLAVAENTRTETYNNKNLVNQLVQSAHDLQNNSGIAFNEMVLAGVKTKGLSGSIKQMIDKLIYTSEVLDKLSNIIVRKKAVNPLISNDLMALLTTAGKDASNAVALALIALKSTFAAQASNMESESAIELAYTQSIDLYQTLTGKTHAGDKSKDEKKGANNSLEQMIHQAYATAKANYTRIENALVIATKQLNEATSDLTKAQVKLQSLQSGLAAANAAALAS